MTINQKIKASLLLASGALFIFSNLAAQQTPSGKARQQKLATDTVVKPVVDLFAEMDAQSKADDKNRTDITTAIFKTTRLINAHSIENLAEGVMDVKISHRFGGFLKDGGYSLWGLDQASMRIGVDYGVTNRLMVGIGRSEYQKTFDAFAKYRLLRQSTGKVNMPVSLSYVGSVQLVTQHSEDLASPPSKYADRFSFVHQIIIARKFNDYLSLQVVPTLVHYNNSTFLSGTQNDYFSVGLGARQRLTKRLNLTYEYYPRITKLSEFKNAFSIGLDIETGGHVFQFNVGNSIGMNEKSFINETTDSWNNRELHFGFNIARVFTIKKPKAAQGI